MNKIPFYIWIAGALFCFALGFFAGGFINRVYIEANFERFAKEYLVKQHKNINIQQKNQEKGKKSLPPEIVKELWLTEEQKEKWEEIFKRYGPEINQIRKFYLTKLASRFDLVDAEILNILDERQKKKFKKMLHPGDIIRMELSSIPDDE